MQTLSSSYDILVLHPWLLPQGFFGFPSELAVVSWTVRMNIKMNSWIHPQLLLFFAIVVIIGDANPLVISTYRKTKVTFHAFQTLLPIST